MSANIFDAHFTAGTEAGGVITVNECSPVDLVRSLVRKLLDDDATVSAAVDDRVEGYDLLPIEINKSGRALYVDARPFEQEDRPSNAQGMLVEATGLIRWSQSYKTQPASDYAPTIWSLVNKCETVLAANHKLTFTFDTVSGNRELDVAENSYPGNATAIEGFDQQAGAVLVGIRFSRIYELKLDHSTGKICRFVEAGVN